MTKQTQGPSMHKLRSIIRHEYMTIVKQLSFWIVMISIPMLAGGAIALSILANQSSAERVQQLASKLDNVVVIDESGLIDSSVAQASNVLLSPSDQKESQQKAVQNGQKSALIVYPSNLLDTQRYEIYLSTTDFTQSQIVSSFGDTLLRSSIYLPLGSTEIIALAQNGAQSTLITYDNGRQTAGINEHIVPGLFIGLFYVIFAFSVGYMLTSVGEEKENRSMEMVLTYTNERSVIVGKLVAVSLVALTQVTFFVIVGLIALSLSQHSDYSLQLPFGLDVNKLVFDPVTIALATGFLIIGFLMFAGFMTAVASIMPSVKEASSLSAVFYIGAFIPFYFISLITTDPENPITRFLTFFPLTSPVVTLIRNAVDNMQIAEALVALITMAAFMLLSLWIAIRAFRLGALEFNSRVRIKQLFTR